MVNRAKKNAPPTIAESEQDQPITQLDNTPIHPAWSLPLPISSSQMLSQSQMFLPQQSYGTGCLQQPALSQAPLQQEQLPSLQQQQLSPILPTFYQLPAPHLQKIPPDFPPAQFKFFWPPITVSRTPIVWLKHGL